MRKNYKKGGSDLTSQVKVNDGPPPQQLGSPPNPSLSKAPMPGKATPGKATPGKETPGKILQPEEDALSESDSSMFSGLFTTLDEYKAEIAIGFCVTLLIIIALLAYNKYKESVENEKTEESNSGNTGGGSGSASASGGSGGASGGNNSSSTSEGFVNYIEDYLNSIFEPGRPDINVNDKNKLLPGFIL